MGQRADSPGQYSPAQQRLGVASVESVAPSSPDPGLDWRQYLDEPDDDRIGISCSGGGIRSAAYCLGALQELRRQGWLERAEYLSCVSGGGYISIAHEVLVSETLAEADGDPCEDPTGGPFASVPPYAIGSPEERHLRSHLSYLTPGLLGRIWFLVSLVGGIIRHLLPFVVVLYIAAWVSGMALTRWLARSLGACPGYELPCHAPTELPAGQQVTLEPYLWITAAMLVVTLVFLVARQWVQSWAAPDDDAIRVLQGWALRWLAATALVAFFLLLVPAALLLLHTRPFDLGGLGKALAALGVEGTGLAAALAIARRMRHGLLKTVGAVANLIITPVVILLPYLGFTYWVAQGGPHVLAGQTWVLLGCVALFVVFIFTNEVTAVPHMLYRERLATAFIGRRTTAPFETVGYEQPPWSKALSLSELRRCEDGPAALPKLVVCANANLSDVVPPGRGGASFTFERDFVGGPVTGYVRTTSLERRTKTGTVTMPALMAISGAAVNPSMGKMTRAGLRFAMALFDLRLGVWLPNPKRDGWQRFTPLDVWAERRAGAPGDAATEAKAVAADPPFRRPGTKYVFLEALGRNSLLDDHLYVSDGGHWENLGLVELLRRGCGKIVCLDAAGDDIHHFNTLSEAIDLAHADLGVEFDLDMTLLTPTAPDDRSPSCSVKGTFTYPNGKRGWILVVKAAICSNAPVEVLSYRLRDPKFPNHPTTNQFFDELTFESYRTLGQHAVREAFDGRGML